MSFNKKLTIIAIVFAVITAASICCVAFAAVGSILMKVGTIVSLFGIIGTIACFKAVSDLKMFENEKTRKIAEQRLKYRTMTMDWSE